MVQSVIFENGHTTQLTDTLEYSPAAQDQLLALDKLATETTEVLYACSSIWPLDIFPDRVIIDENKVTIVQKMFMFKRTFPVPILDVQTVRVIQSFIFSSLEIEVKGYDENPPVVSHLWPWEATRAKQYILGLLEAKRQGVDLTALPTERTKKRLRIIGKTLTEE